MITLMLDNHLWYLGSYRIEGSTAKSNWLKIQVVWRYKCTKTVKFCQLWLLIVQNGKDCLKAKSNTTKLNSDYLDVRQPSLDLGSKRIEGYKAKIIWSNIKVIWRYQCTKKVKVCRLWLLIVQKGKDCLKAWSNTTKLNSAYLDVRQPSLVFRIIYIYI